MKFKPPISPENYGNLVGLEHLPLAEKFYEELKREDLETVEKYEKDLSVKGFPDLIGFIFDDFRRSKLAAVRRVIYENRNKNLESKTE